MSILLPIKKHAAFKKWLTGQGASILAPTNPYELIRFESAMGVGVLYENNAGSQKTNQGNAMRSAIGAFTSGGANWKGKGTPTPRKDKRSERKTRRKKLAERDGAECFFCGDDSDLNLLTLEHFCALAAGGPDKLTNMVLACTDCNDEVGTMNVAEKCQYRDKKRGHHDLYVSTNKTNLNNNDMESKA